jgi:hypothetical protein
MKHLWESGISPRVLKSFVQSMSNSVHVQVDELIEDFSAPAVVQVSHMISFG